MKIVQAMRTKDGVWQQKGQQELQQPLVLVFGDRSLLEDKEVYKEVRHRFPTGNLVFGSTSGEILYSQVREETLSVTAIEFEFSNYTIASANCKDFDSIQGLGAKLASELKQEGLAHVFVVSDGSLVNGSGLIEGLDNQIKGNIPITGGLCGDGTLFEKTLSSYNESPKEGNVIAIGFYGEQLEVTYASNGGWTPFGPERTITKSDGNVLFEIDGQPALNLYKTYLGEKANELPQAALLYPLSLQETDGSKPLVRTILNIDEGANSMILAGDVPVGSKVQLMMSTTDDIANGAASAAVAAMTGRVSKPQLAILVSCVGRKLVLDQRTEEEIEEVVEVIGDQASVTGFYSYGEMAPFSDSNRCRLHNQTMTLTLISE